MRVSLLALPFVILGLSGCVDVHEHPAPRSATVVTPAPEPMAPPVTYAAPGTSTTIVTRP